MKMSHKVGQLWPKVEDWNWETIFADIYRSIINHCDVIGQQSIEFGEKTQNKGYYAVQGHSRSSRTVSIESPYAASYTVFQKSNAKIQITITTAYLIRIRYPLKHH